MTTMPTASVAEVEDASDDLSEDYLRLVDRVGQLRKQADPYRMEQVQRAFAQEVQLAHCGGMVPEDRSHRGNGVESRRVQQQME